MTGPSRTSNLTKAEPVTGRQVTLSAPSRLHFGLLSIGRDLPVNFGGAGLMLQQPRTEIHVEQADSFSVSGADLDWIERMVRRWQAGSGIQANGLPPVRITISNHPFRHIGLGSGTQMALSLASALCRMFDLGEPAPVELAMMMGRGRRSSIGTFGFFRGGFLVDRGHESGDRISPLDLRLEFPTDWPIVLLTPKLAPGSHGSNELDAFDRAARSDPGIRQQMVKLLNESSAPSIAARNFEVFCRSIHDFNVLSGDYYHSVQGGTWHSPAVAGLVEHVREMGVPGIIQSSWGPGLAAFTGSLPAAQALVQNLAKLRHPALPADRIQITKADNDGAVAKNSNQLRNIVG